MSQPSSPNPYEILRQQRQENSFRHSLFQPTIITDASHSTPHYPIVPDTPQSKNPLKRHLKLPLKLVIVGDGGCGKTCLLASYIQRKFPTVYVPTVFENYVATLAVPNYSLDTCAEIDLALWDTAGQEEYDRLRPLSYPGADLILVCFALDNSVSFQNVRDTWFPEVQHFCPGVPLLLVGLKSDLPSAIAPLDPARLASEMLALAYISCLAKDMTNVETVFDFAAHKLFHQYLYQQQVERLKRNRLSRVIHLSTGSAASVMSHARTSLVGKPRGHLKNTSYDSSVLLDAPLTEDTSQINPYGDFASDKHKYNLHEYEFAQEKQKRRLRCQIL